MTHCGLEQELYWANHSNGRHIGARCAQCKVWLKWVTQTPAAVAAANAANAAELDTRNRPPQFTLWPETPDPARTQPEH